MLNISLFLTIFFKTRSFHCFTERCQIKQLLILYLSLVQRVNECVVYFQMN
uniref:Uncharacterized protein n=1 Tax=Anguilla anguilla TaxID=7936 RepID=A0A0E9VKL2_ANGAN